MRAARKFHPLSTYVDNSFFTVYASLNTMSKPRKLKAAVLDLSGTIVDPFSNAPNWGLIHAFNKEKIKLKMSQCRDPMGSRKDKHIEELFKKPDVAKLWLAEKGKPATSEDVERIFKQYKISQIEVLHKEAASCTTLIHGTADVFKTLRSELQMNIGATTGFPKNVATHFLEEMSKQGVKLDSCVAADEVEKGRPHPAGMYLNFERFGIDRTDGHLVVKAGDTDADMEEGEIVKSWRVALYETSSYMDLNDVQSFYKLTTEEWLKRTAKAKKKLLKREPDFLVPTISYLPLICRKINNRLANGYLPGQLPTVVLNETHPSPVLETHH